MDILLTIGALYVAAYLFAQAGPWEKSHFPIIARAAKEDILHLPLLIVSIPLLIVSIPILAMILLVKSREGK